METAPPTLLQESRLRLPYSNICYIFLFILFINFFVTLFCIFIFVFVLNHYLEISGDYEMDHSGWMVMKRRFFSDLFYCFSQICFTSSPIFLSASQICAEAEFTYQISSRRKNSIEKTESSGNMLLIIQTTPQFLHQLYLNCFHFFSFFGHPKFGEYGESSWEWRCQACDMLCWEETRG